MALPFVPTGIPPGPGMDPGIDIGPVADLDVKEDLRLVDIDFHFREMIQDSSAEVLHPFPSNAPRNPC